MHDSTRWHVCEDAVAAGAAQRILTAAETAITARGAFRMVLAGGRTPLLQRRVLPTARSRWT